MDLPSPYRCPLKPQANETCGAVGSNRRSNVAEWQEQGETIDVPAMLCPPWHGHRPVAVNRAEVDAVTLKFAETDLLCYWPRTAGVVARQAKSWQPLLDWAGSTCKRHLS